jgi:hypothetical protein
VGRPSTRWTDGLVKVAEAAGCGKHRTNRRGDPCGRPMPVLDTVWLMMMMIIISSGHAKIFTRVHTDSEN